MAIFPDVKFRLETARLELSRVRCGHVLVCADPKCWSAGHDAEHETTSDGEGWCCGHDECKCLPACRGFEPDICPDAKRLRDVLAAIDEALVTAAVGRGT